ncbi:Transient receptor potential channel pyrexia [Amphibalanus amphitrite]|uniref:Transient receptor potential channel pyrexia n=1 Tax=Amphibalanus amphitrite TaxID=1232801 RepID=A0A6A4WPX1_AMPAM|nr:Transient receptor potential channel pyrexia [Amphibalanus amphitrite]
MDRSATSSSPGFAPASDETPSRPAETLAPPPHAPAADGLGRRLLEACSAGDVEAARAALQAGAHPALLDPAGYTALHRVAAGWHSPETTARLVRLLHDWGAPLETANARGQRPVLQAAEVGNTAALLVLAELGAVCDAVDHRGNTLLHLAASSGNPQTVSAALDRLPADAVGQLNQKGLTPLQVAKNRETVRPLLGAGAQADEPTALMLLKNMPSAMPDVLDRYMTTNGQPLDSSQLEVYLDYMPFWDVERKKPAPETALLRAIVDADQSALLKHPLIETFMHVKWLQIRPFFYFNFAFFMCFALLVTAYGMLRTRQPNDRITQVVGLLTAVFTALTGVRELLQVAHGVRSYFGSVDNWLELLLLVLSTALLAVPDAQQWWVHHVAAWLMLAAWLELTLMIGRIPAVGIYIYMFVRVAQKLIGFLLVYSPLLVAFALSFYVVFGETDAYKSIPLSLIKTFVMMMGEYEYNSAFIDHSPTYLGTSHVLMVLFIVSMPIITVNLLIGLTVNDIQSVFMTAGLERLRITVIQILLIDWMVNNMLRLLQEREDRADLGEPPIPARLEELSTGSPGAGRRRPQAAVERTPGDGDGASRVEQKLDKVLVSLSELSLRVGVLERCVAPPERYTPPL